MPACNGGGSCSANLKASLDERLAANRAWAGKKGPAFFNRLMGIQDIEVLWIGCSDARLPANELIGLKPGEVFVQRNVGNLATHKDMNVMACLEYAVNVLKVKHIIVCGHYGCDAVRTALLHPCKNEGLVNLWVQDIRDTRDRNVEALRQVAPGQPQVDRLVELNVLRQVFNVCTSPIVQQAWDAGQALAVHGLVYRMDDGLLQPLYTTDTAPVQPGSFLKSGSGCSSPGTVARASWAGSSGSQALSLDGDGVGEPAGSPGLAAEETEEEAQERMSYEP